MHAIEKCFTNWKISHTYRYEIDMIPSFFPGFSRRRRGGRGGVFVIFCNILGLQHGVIHGSAPYGLNLNEKLLPEYLRSLNYVTRHVGKWHLGSFKKDYTPEYRG